MYQQSVNSLDLEQALYVVGPDLCQKCLQRFSPDITMQQK